MPIMTDPVTGERKEISMEEFREAMRGGRLTGIQQVVTDAQGNQRVTDIYGNMPGSSDGFERSANIFMNLTDIGVFLTAALEGNSYGLDPNRKTDDNIEMLVELMDHPMSYKLTKTLSFAKLERSVRDEVRSWGQKELCGQWDLNNGEMTIDGESLQSDRDLVFLVVFSQVRKFIEAEGLLAQLKELNDSAAGVLISVADGQPKAKLVRGMTRPALPCAILGGLLGVDTIRPYPEEAISDMFMDDMGEEDLEEAAEGGDPDAMERLALGYLNGDIMEKDFARSAYWMEKLAELDSAFAQFNLGLFYAKGCGVPRDFDKASYWMKRAAENGDDDAEELAIEFGKILRDEEKAYAGDAQAQADMAAAMMRLGGSLDQFGDRSDFAESFRWAKLSAKQGNGDGMWALALCYEHGRGIAPNPTAAVKWYREGANIGHASCQHSLGCKYMVGDLIGKDEELAFDLFMKSAGQGNGLAMRDVGRCYQFGNGVDHNMTLAIAWYEKALQVLDDPELERKVAVFKMLESSFDDDVWEDEGESEPEFEPPEGYEEALAGFIDEELAKRACMLARAMRDGYMKHDPKTGRTTFNAVVTGTQYEGRMDAVKELSVGDTVYLVREPQNESNPDNVSVRSINGASLGNLYASTCGALAPLMDEGIPESMKAKVVELVLPGDRGPRAKKAELKIAVEMLLPDAVQSTVCALGGDQVRTWAQRLEVLSCAMPTSHAKLLFELHNRLSGEYTNFDAGRNDTSYAGLDNLEEEILVAREKLQAERNPALDYSGKGDDCQEYMEFGAFVLEKIEQEPARYGALAHYNISESDELRYIFDRYTLVKEEYFWLDQTRVDKAEFDEVDWFNHWYNVMELYDGTQLPVDLEDEDVVSIFGCGKFEAFADLSYGC